MDIIKTITEELNIKIFQTENTVELLIQGNTVPFISRYRKERTGNLDEEKIRNIEELYRYYQNLEEYKKTVLRNIEEQGKLTDDLKEKIVTAKKMNEVEDLYLPYKKRKKTNADKAIESGLQPVANKILLGSLKTFKELEEFITEDYDTLEKVSEGISYIIGQTFAHDKDRRESLRKYYEKYGKIYSEKKKDYVDQDTKYDMYHEFNQDISKIQNYRVLALNRGEKEGILNVKLLIDDDWLNLEKTKYKTNNELCNEIIFKGLDYGYKNMLNPSIEREIRQILTDKAEIGAIELFSKNLRQLLLTPPLKNKRVLAIDPGFRTGCKVVVLDELGNLLENNTIFPVPPQNDIEGSEKILLELIEKHKVNLIAIGNGTASRETQQFIVDLIHKNELNLKYIFVDESGASVYSASKLAKEEFPNYDVTVRGAISLGRRIQDPLSEFVKIDPKSIGVGQYQHDVNQKKLKDKLDATVESVVNNVGVNLNTASYSLLEYVSGISKSLAKKIVEFRQKNGSFKKRDELLKVKGFGEKSFEQSAGFLRIIDGENPLEITGIHPESYETAEKVINILGFRVNDLKDNDKLESLKLKVTQFLNQKEKIKEISKELETGEYTLLDILKELQKPGRDPRDEMPQPLLMDDVLKFEDLKEGMHLSGKITNITDFGAFVDLGIKENGLIHKSNLSEKFIHHPSEVVQINDIVEVEIVNIDKNRKRVGLKLINIK
ncbi:hypothetical protein PW5551_05640 [Petrotoga sp. 9PW.55.5.1]|uniref:Tex family protein n=1 Tax=Petrotoga sp. 9PW.55.5.1 TaxID=1308979 RepID=UPI000DC34CFF|nr:Tex family protein [Petrotoga sp. 9PW.55.5.1]RAO99162.1 hypothetical protein PW5551_05640 [Petrotoga sp. 9PW.55.5.1]